MNSLQAMRGLAAVPVFLIALISGRLDSAAADASGQTPTVAVVKVARESLAQDATFDAELRPYQEIDLHAKVSGYLETLEVDVGDRVKTGQVIGRLEVPELKSELAHVLASEQKARAMYEEARVALERLSQAAKAQKGLIAQQDLDTAAARSHSAEASVAAAQADVQKYQTLLAYTQITAPFDGVVTKRYVHRGALIQAGTSSSAGPLVRISQADKLRVAFPVSLSFVTQIKESDPVEIRVSSVGRTFEAKVSRFSRKVETATRTMEAEADLDNQDLTLIPGVYATVIVKLGRRAAALTAPVEAVARDKKGATVFVVTKENKIEERTVTLGVETPAKVEITAGVAEGEMVMVGSRTQVQPGQVVQVKVMEAARQP